MSPPSSAAAPVRRARSSAPSRALPAAPRPRRVSGPARRVVAVPGVGAPGLNDGGLVVGLLERLAARSRYRLVDRLLSGRIWIGLVAFALIGIVTLQLGLLKLNAGVGHALVREATLQRENATLSIENSELAAGPRVEAGAGRLGMQLIPSGALQFLVVHPRSDAAHAASALSAHVEAPSAVAAQAGPEGTSAESPGQGGSSEASAGTTPSAAPEATSPGSESPSAPGESSSTTAAAPVQSAQGASEAQAPAASTPPSSAESTPTGGAQAGPAE
jgi:hypothetical protein